MKPNFLSKVWICVKGVPLTDPLFLNDLTSKDINYSIIYYQPIPEESFFFLIDQNYVGYLSKFKLLVSKCPNFSFFSQAKPKPSSSCDGWISLSYFQTTQPPTHPTGKVVKLHLIFNCQAQPQLQLRLRLALYLTSPTTPHKPPTHPKK